MWEFPHLGKYIERPIAGPSRRADFQEGRLSAAGDHGLDRRVVPANTPAGTVERLNNALRAALKSSEASQGYATLMMDPSSESPRDAARMVQAE
jgi:hypothetical protein